MIPRRLFWITDIFVLGLGFLVAHSFVPSLRSLLVPGGILNSPWIQSLLSPAPEGSQLSPLPEMLWFLFTMAPATLLFMEILGGYRPLLGQSRARIAGVSLLAPMAGLSLITLIMFAVKSPAWSRLFAFSFAAFCSLGLGSTRLAIRAYYSRRLALGYYRKNVALIGPTPALEWILRYFAEDIPVTEYRLMGYFGIGSVPPAPSLLRQDGTQTTEVLEPLPPLGDVTELGDFLIRNPVHEVIAVQPADGGAWLKQVIKDCDYYRVTLRIVPEALLEEDLSSSRVMFHLLPLRLPDIVLRPRYLDTEALFFKRAFDIVASAALLILLSPLFGVIALAIKLTNPRLPVFYRWHVVGQNGVEFTGYKFSTMFADADERKADLMAQNIMDGPVFKLEHDPRVTPLGRFLRKFSLNELPQLWSVLKGEMSLVGPRPAFKHELDRYEFWQKRKLSIRPGITCLWQVRGRNKIRKFDDWVRMDLEYIDNWSLWLDFKILFRTIWVVLSGTGS